MGKPLVDRTNYDHPEHFDDTIREYRTSKRYIPTPLESLLFELAGHRCTICHAPWLEIHHIKELEHGGETVFENLIVLCPNCHTRVHAQGIPSPEELRHYKLKQEIAYELPIINRLTDDEKALIREVASLPPEKQIIFSKLDQEDIPAKDQAEAIEVFRAKLGLYHLQESGMVTVETQAIIMRAEGDRFLVALHTRLTSKGVKWCRYLAQSGRIP